MALSPAVRLFAGVFTISLLFTAVLAYHLSHTMVFAFAVTPEALATLTKRIQIVRAAGLAFALGLMLLVIVAGSREARGALAVRWLLGVATSFAFLRGAGLVNPLPHHDRAIIAVSAIQLALEAIAILLLYGEDATDWFERRRAPRRRTDYLATGSSV